MSEDYAKGFKDGFAAGLEEGKKINDKTYTDGFIEGMKKTLPPPYIPPIPPPGPNWIPNWTLEVKEYCPKCGIKISGVMGYVCGAIDCPTGMGGVSYTIGSTDIGKPVTGRVDHTPGYNGLSPPDDNSVWVNGSSIKDAVGYNAGANGPAGTDEKQYDGRGWRIK